MPNGEQVSSEEKTFESKLAHLRRVAEAGDAYIIDWPVLLALVRCAEVVHTDYLLLSADQQMTAAEALEELGL
jgi:hypothetical protein